MNRNNSTWKAVALAVVAAAGAATASAQSAMLTGAVPFNFSIGGGVTLGAGNYAVSHVGNLWLIRDQDTGRAMPVINTVGHVGSETERPALVFDCIADHCRLRAIHAGGLGAGADLPRPKMTKAQAETITELVVPLGLAGGE